MKKLPWICIYGLYSIFYCCYSLAADAQQYNISLAPFSGQLSQPTITAIHEDRDGFLWIGTQSGLNRYDGSRITIFSSGDNAKNWVPASDISQIAESSEGELWIATYGGGLAKYNDKKNLFEKTRGSTENGYAFLKSLHISDNGILWFGTRDAGVGMYDPKLQKYAPWLKSNSLNQNMGQTSDILEDKSGQIWASGKDGIYSLDPKEKTIQLYPLPASIKPPGSLVTVTAIELGSQKTIWVGTNAGNVLNFSLKNLTYTIMDKNNDSPTGWVTDLAYSNNRLWIATDNGLSIQDKDGLVIRRFTHSNSNLSINDTICLYFAGNTIYVGTTNGLNVIFPNSFEKYQSKNSHISNDVLSFAEGVDDTIWVGTYDGVFYLNNESKFHFTLENLYQDLKLADRRIMAMSINANELWLGFFRGGVQIIDLKSGARIDSRLPNNADLSVTSIKHTRDGLAWVSTYNQGLFRLSDTDVQSLFHAPDINRIPELTVYHVLETSNGSILVGTETNVYEVDRSTGRVQLLNFVFRKDGSKPVILSLTQDKNGKIWIGTQNQGLFIWAFNSEHSHSDTIHPEFAKGNASIPSSTIYAIEFDDEGNAWLSTTGGISKLSSEGEFIKNYTTADGLQGNDFNFSSSFRDSQGRLYFGGSNGYNRFDPDKSAVSTEPPPVVLTGINIAGRDPKLPVAIHKLEALELSYKDYFVSFEFSVLDFTDPKNNQFRYKLKNFDPQWIENGTRNSATYTNLPAGVYYFQVQGANSAGVWNREGTSLRLVVHPAPWWTWQAYLIYFAMLIGLVLVVKQYYDNSVISKRAAIMTREAHDVADRATDQLQEQMEYQDEFVKIVHAHSLNTLELISDFITQQAMFVDDELTRDAILNNTARVSALAQLEGCLFYQGDQLLANLESYTNSIIDGLLLNSPELAESLTTINEMPSRLIPVELATPLSIIIYELLHNCFQHAFEEPSRAMYIQIALDRQDAENQYKQFYYKLTVKDSGVGVPDNVSPTYPENTGFAIVRSVVHGMSGKLSISGQPGTTVSIVFSSEVDIL